MSSSYKACAFLKQTCSRNVQSKCDRNKDKQSSLELHQRVRRRCLAWCDES